MEFKDFNPYLRYFDKVQLNVSYTQFLKAYDFRLFYVLSGSFSIKFENETINLTEKDLITIPPGTAYKLQLEKNKKATYYILNFDFNYCAENQSAKAPVPIKLFNENDIFSTFSVPPYNSIFVLKNATFAEEILDEINDLILTQIYQEKSIKTTLLKYLLTKAIIRHENTATSSLTKALIEKAKDYINKNIIDCPSNEAIAKAMGYHSYYLNYLFVTYERITLHRYMDNVRLKRAKDLLICTNLPICEIAEKSGFSDASYFSRTFKKSVGMTPKQYRNLSK